MLDLLGVANRKRDLHGGKGELKRTDGSEREKDRKRRKERERDIYILTAKAAQIKYILMRLLECVVHKVILHRDS